VLAPDTQTHTFTNRIRRRVCARPVRNIYPNARLSLSERNGQRNRATDTMHCHFPSRPLQFGTVAKKKRRSSMVAGRRLLRRWRCWCLLAGGRHYVRRPPANFERANRLGRGAQRVVVFAQKQRTFSFNLGPRSATACAPSPLVVVFASFPSCALLCSALLCSFVSLVSPLSQLWRRKGGPCAGPGM
jgi:hypothetical protein